METEPYQDTLPPRHALESDSEDEGNYASRGPKRAPKPYPNVMVEWNGPQEKPRPLLIALEEAGRQWIQGIELGDVKGRVLLDDVEVASAYCPSWAEVTIVAISLRLPTYTMHAFASMVLTVIRPTNVVIIDAYAVPSYISSSPASLHAPIRYLRTTAASKTPSPPKIEPYHPPNLIQSPAASFLSILESPTHPIPATLLLLPSAHIPPPAPPDLGSSSGPVIQDEWEASTLTALHTAVNGVVGTNVAWSVKHLSGRTAKRGSRKGDVGEGGMYI